MYSRSLSSRGLKASAGYSVNPLFSARSDRSRPPRYLRASLATFAPEMPGALHAGETLLAVDDPDFYNKRSQRRGGKA